jgi:hypothetical protein
MRGSELSRLERGVTRCALIGGRFNAIAFYLDIADMLAKEGL